MIILSGLRVEIDPKAKIEELILARSKSIIAILKDS